MEWIKDKLNGLVADILNGWKSLTLWVNGVVLALIPIVQYAQEVFPQLQAYISPEFYKQAMVVLLVTNLALRFKTNSALRDK